jgi:protein-tyrosine phosphatase
MTGSAELRPSIDIHSHLVPGVDDGASTVEDVLEGLGRLTGEGVSTLVTTPHLDGSLTLLPQPFAERMSQIDEAFARARKSVEDSFPELTFHRANEVALDHPEPDLSDPRMRLSPSGGILVEWPRLRVPPGSPRVLERLGEQGIPLVLAHPERYRLGEAAMERMEEWREAGAIFQVNYGSLVGAFGPDARQRSLKLLARGWVDLLASDFHGRPRLPLHIAEARDTVLSGGREEGDGVEAWIRLTRTNPQRILDGEAPLAVPPLGNGGTLWARFTSLFR